MGRTHDTGDFADEGVTPYPDPLDREIAERLQRERHPERMVDGEDEDPYWEGFGWDEDERRDEEE